MSAAILPAPPIDRPAEPPPPAPAAPPASLLLALVTDWAQLDELRLACRTSEPNYRRHHALSALLACSRAEMVAALLAQRARTPTISASEDCSLAALLLSGALRHEALSALLQGVLASLMHHWLRNRTQIADAVSRLGSAIVPRRCLAASTCPGPPWYSNPPLRSRSSAPCPRSSSAPSSLPAGPGT